MTYLNSKNLESVLLLEEENPPEKKSSSEQVFLNNFRWVPDSCHREEGESSRELFEKVRVNTAFFLVFRDFGWVFGPLYLPNPMLPHSLAEPWHVQRRYLS